MGTASTKVLIDGPGRYRTRNGREVEIHAVCTDGRSSWPAKGHLIKTDSLGRRRRHYRIWQLDGQYLALGEHSWDIVSKEPEA